MPKSNDNLARLNRSVEQEDEHLNKRFERATSTLLRGTTRKRSIRETLSMTREDIELIGKLRERSFSYSVAANKSEIVRAGLRLMSMASEAQFRQAMDEVERL